ncbi:MAG: helix-turn-helix transcriptional regulator [DPANN group archaeon]|nr:helix-turn-helix transcriptional regulator [DPANN group archaeon]
MQDDNYLLISLKDEKSKKLAQVISNETSRKVLDLLTKKDATETEIAKALNIPLSTVHYNMKALVRSGLVKVEEFHYSEKGKEVNHYSLANKVIIIAPSRENSWKQAMKNFLPIGMFGLAATFIVFLWEKLSFGGGVFSQAVPLTATRIAAESAPIMNQVASQTDKAVAVAKEAVQDMVASAPVPEAVNASHQTIGSAVAMTPAEPNLWLWFLLGTAFTLTAMILWEWLRQRKR